MAQGLAATTPIALAILLTIMVDSRGQLPPRRLLGALSGLKAGVLGALAICVFMSVAALIDRDPWWSYPNLLATAFYGPRGLHLGLGWPTVAGLAFQVLMGGVAGILFGVTFAGVQSGARLLLLGIIWGVSWYYLTHSLFRVFARLIPIYAPELALLTAHSMFGAIVGSVSRIRWTGAPVEVQPTS